MNGQPTSGPPDRAPGSGSEREGHRIRAGEFEGPLDLLLHLVRVNEVDIANIPIVEITDQYNEYLGMMRELNLAIAGEYLLMASTLMHIKSRMLLPPDPQTEEGEDSDPRAELAQQLLDYQRFKQAAENLQAMDSLRSLVWTREGQVPEEFEGEELVVVDLFDLMKAFRQLLHRLGEEAKLQFKRDDVSVAEKITWLTDLLEERGSVDFLELIAGVPSRLERIALFLAILEMSRLQLLVAFQRKTLGDIRIAMRSDSEQGAAPAGESTGASADLTEPPARGGSEVEG